MSNTYQIYLISDSTGETLDRVFLAIKAQFKNIEYDVKSYFFTRTENQVSKIMEEAKKNDNAIILYTIVYTSLEMIRKISYMLYPIIPDSVKKALVIFNLKTNDIDFESIGSHNFLKAGNNINKIDILFKKIEKIND